MSYYFELGGCSIAVEAVFEFSQSYESINGTVVHRTQSGKAIKQTHFKKLKTVLSGKGWIPTGLDELDYSKPLLLKCAIPLSISSKNNQLLLPQGRRMDSFYNPKGFCLINGHLIETNLTIDHNLAILDHVDNANAYHVHYYPELYVYAEPPQVHGNVTSAEFTWSITCEEV